jgi:hypothetical protein
LLHLLWTTQRRRTARRRWRCGAWPVLRERGGATCSSLVLPVLVLVLPVLVLVLLFVIVPLVALLLVLLILLLLLLLLSTWCLLVSCRVVLGAYVSFFGVFPMFVLSLSWLKDRIYI